ncbi:DsbA family oxidoreductase [Nonomuraea sp. NPDC046570]|uniref:DsbA family oxidoreductase n=1 Tax=Nonomuraea sp. NPDC046570 TaxID=3155255 RepID=UPI0033D3735D
MTIEVWVDVICPWCYLAKRRLEAALRESGGTGGVLWRSYELVPEAPAVPGLTTVETMIGFGEDGREVTARFARIRRLGRQEGLTLNLPTARPVNSFDAHRLIHLAGRYGRRGQALEAVLRAYHTDNLDIADHDVLAGLAEQAGLDPGEARRALALGGPLAAEDHLGELVRADERRAAELGVRGVPAFVRGGEVVAAGLPSQQALTALLLDLHEVRGEVAGMAESFPAADAQGDVRSPR